MGRRGNGFSLIAILAAVFGGGAISVSHAETWYYVGGGTQNQHSYDWTASDNWTNALNEAGAPLEGDSVAFPPGAKSTTVSASTAVWKGRWQLTQPIDYMDAQVSMCVHQGSVNFIAGGRGLRVARGGTWFGGLWVTGQGDVTVDVPEGAAFKLQKKIEGSHPAEGGILKKGAGTFRLLYELGDYGKNTILNYRLREGTFEFCTDSTKPGATLHFDSCAGAVFRIGRSEKGQDVRYANLTLQDGFVGETGEIEGTDHGFDSYGEDVKQLLIVKGVPKGNPLRFTGKFRRKSGLVWNPDDSGVEGAPYEFRFAKAVQDGAGDVIVSNGTVRVCEGAAFAGEMSVEIENGGAFAVDEGSGAGMRVGALRVAEGGRLELGRGVMMVAGSAEYAGAALSPGVHTAADCAFLDGDGMLLVPYAEAYAPGEASAATWTHAGETAGLITERANWEGGAAAPDFASRGLVADFGSGGAAKLPAAGTYAFKGIEAAAGTRFEDGGGAAVAMLGEGGVKVKGTAGRVHWGWPAFAETAQIWEVPAGTELELAGPLYGDSGEIGFEGAGTKIFSGRQRYAGDMHVSGGAMRVHGVDALGATGGKTRVNLDATEVHFHSSTNSREICLTNNATSKTMAVAAGARVEFGGLVRHEGHKNIAFRLESGARVDFLAGLRTQQSTTFATSSGEPREVHFRNVPLYSYDRWYMRDPGLTIHFHEEGNRISGNTGDWERGKIVTHVPYALKGNVGGANQRCLVRNDFTIDLAGNDQGMGLYHATGGIVTSATHAVLHVANNYLVNNYDDIPQRPKDSAYVTGYYGVTNKTCFAGGAGFSLEGSIREHRMLALSTSTGTVGVAKGRLVMAAPGGAWPNAYSATVTDGGTLEVEHGGAFGNGVRLCFEGSGKIELAEGVRLWCAGIWVDGARLPSGTYGGPESAAANRNGELFAGTGVVMAYDGTEGTCIIVR